MVSLDGEEGGDGDSGARYVESFVRERCDKMS